MTAKVFKTKNIEYNGPKTILVQNENGPCPLIATVNTLVIAGSPIVMSLLDKPEVTVEELGGILHEVCQEPGSKSAFRKYFPTLTDGLDINPRFNGTFAQTEELDLFQEFGLQLVHGWVIAPSELPQKYSNLASGAAKINFDDYNIDRIQGLNEEEKVVDWFVKKNPSQLSIAGILYLISHLKPDTPAVFFRNNHYGTIILHEDVLYTLATDEGLAHKPVVWEALTEISGAGKLCDADFEPMRPEPDVSQDEEIARLLAAEEQAEWSSQIERDNQLARQLAGEPAQVSQPARSQESRASPATGRPTSKPPNKSKPATSQSGKLKPAPQSGKSKKRDCIVS